MTTTDQPTSPTPAPRTATPTGFDERQRELRSHYASLHAETPLPELRDIAVAALADRDLLDTLVEQARAANAVLRQERNEARAEIPNQQRAFELMLGEVRRERDAAEGRYRQLAGEVERIADQANRYVNATSHMSGAAVVHLRALRGRLAATAPQTAPDVDRIADLIAAKGAEIEPLTRGFDRSPVVPADAPESPTAADLGPVRETGEDLARLFHETYERLAPDFGYRTRQASAKPWNDVPEANRALMVATAGHVLAALRSSRPAGDEHLQALRDELRRRDIDPQTQNPVDVVLNHLDYFRRRTEVEQATANEARRDLDLWRERYNREYRRVDEVAAERDVARREAERLRGEVGKIADDIDAAVLPFGVGYVTGTYMQREAAVFSARLRRALDADGTTSGSER